MTARTTLAFLAVSALCAGASRSRAAVDTASVRKSVEGARTAIVTVEAVAKLSSSEGGDDSKREMNLEVNGTVIDPNGLTVLSLPDIDPSALLTQLMGAPAGSIQSEVSNVRLLMDDGTEIPAKMVLRDKEQNLAFVRPATRPTTPMAYVDLKSSAAADVLDDVVILSRMSKVGNHTLRARLDQVESVIPKPRRRYVLGTITMGSELGGTVINPEGKSIGILTLKATRAGENASQSAMSGNLAQVVVPCDDVLEVAAQAPENAAPEPVVTKPAPAKPAVPAKKTPAKKAPVKKAPAKKTK
jgi:S1-C subfamily serine protease